MANRIWKDLAINVRFMILRAPQQKNLVYLDTSAQGFFWEEGGEKKLADWKFNDIYMSLKQISTATDY